MMNANAVAKIAETALKQAIAVLRNTKTLPKAVEAVVKVAEKVL